MAESVFLLYETRSGAEAVVKDLGGEERARVIKGANGQFVAHIMREDLAKLSSARAARVTDYSTLATAKFWPDQ